MGATFWCHPLGKRNEKSVGRLGEICSRFVFILYNVIDYVSVKYVHVPQCPMKWKDETDTLSLVGKGEVVKAPDYGQGRGRR